MRCLCLCLGPVVMAILVPAFAQRPPLEADRPDQTESPAIVPAGWFQLEMGGVREETRDGLPTRLNWSAPAALAKVGLARWAELRVVLEHSILDAMGDGSARTSGVLPVEAGAKFSIGEEEGWRPRTSIIVHAGIPWLAHPDLQVHHYYGTFRFTMQHTLSERFSLGYNLGAEQDGDSRSAAGIYTCTVGAEVSERLGGYLELYGSVADDAKPDHRFDGGFTFRCGPDVLLDASAGSTIGDGNAWYVSIGCSFRCPVFRSRTSTM